MKTTRRHTVALTAAVLAGSLLLGACVDAAADDAAEQPRSVSAADLAEDARKAGQRYAHLSLSELRRTYPSAGLEVPPPHLRPGTFTEDATGNKDATGKFAQRAE
jgi:hypothetical protein